MLHTVDHVRKLWMARICQLYQMFGLVMCLQSQGMHAWCRTGVSLGAKPFSQPLCTLPVTIPSHSSRQLYEPFQNTYQKISIIYLYIPHFVYIFSTFIQPCVECSLRSHAAALLHPGCIPWVNTDPCVTQGSVAHIPE